MAAYRIDGGRLYYVEHECLNAKSEKPNTRHIINNKVHNSKYVVRMFYIGDMSLSRSNVNNFAYMTDGVASSPETYVNCPLCAGEGRVSTDANNLVDIRETFNRSEVTESPFR